MDDLNQNQGGTPTPPQNNVIVPDKSAGSSPTAGVGMGGSIPMPPVMAPEPKMPDPPMPPAPPIASTPMPMSPADPVAKSDDSLMPHKQPTAPSPMASQIQTNPMSTVLPEMEKRTGKKTWLWIILGVLVIAAGYVLYQYYLYNKLYGTPAANAPQTTGNTPVVQTTPPAVTPPDEVTTIQNDLNNMNFDNLGSETKSIDETIK